MEYKLKKERIAVSEIVLDAFTELPLECDLLLPDYCPDIVKVLKCQATPAFSRTEAATDRCVLEGAVMVVVWYTGEDGKLRTSEHRVDFAKTLELKSTPQNPVVFCSAKEDYLNCKAVNQRRIDLRGAFTVTVKILSMGQEEMVAAADGAGLQLNRRQVMAGEMVDSAYKKFTIRDDLELGDNMPSMEYVVRHNEEVRVTEWKISGGKLIVKGLLDVFLEYQPQEGSPQTARWQLPVSQMLDVDAAGEESFCQVWFDLLWASLHPQADGDGQTRMAAGEFTLSVRGVVMKESAVFPASDAYSTQYELQISQKQASLLHLAPSISWQTQLRQEVQLPDYVKEPLDFWCETGALSVLAGEENLTVSGKLRWCLLGVDSDGTPVYFEEAQAVEETIPLMAKAASYLPQVSLKIADCAYEAGEGGRLVCRCKLLAEGFVLGTGPVSFITGIKVDEAREKKREDQSAMTIYYADEGENIWSIAKRYNTSLAAVMEENGIEDEILHQKQILLIPMVG